MARPLAHKPLRFQQNASHSNTYRVLLWISLILGAAWLAASLFSGTISSPLMPTPTPTRSANSYIQQAQVYFEAGKLDDPNSEADAIDTYLKALAVDPNNAQVLAELARIQTYSSSALNTDQARLARLQEARDNIRKAAQLAPDDTTVLAIQAFVMDWNSSSNLISIDEQEAYLAEAEAAANRAYLLDPQNALALAFYAEVLLDQQKWDQALEYAKQAVDRAPDSMDAHRVYATVLENLGAYRDAISEYERAAELAPNMTFLYLRIGLGYRNLASRVVDNKAQSDALYEQSLEYFARAAEINKQLGVQDPTPYIAIAKAYTQQGQFFIAARNAETALRFSPTSADTYGQLGMIYVQARNYESALPALQCAVEGCTAEQNKTAQEFMDQGLLEQSYAVEPLQLTNLTVAYYYIRYASVLGYLADEDNDYCERSLDLMAKLRAFGPDDAVLLENVAINESTCRTFLSLP